MIKQRSLLISGLLATGVTVFGLSGVSSSELDLPGLNQRIDNIDARTTNSEQDIVKLQESTSTAPAEHMVVPDPVTVKVVPPPADPTPAPAFIEPAPATPAPTTAPTPVPCITPVISNAPGISIVIYQPEGCR
ncbi:hypothetical protein QFZ36_000518 [Pseudarthrobacter siccitolerans]|uniref:Uncharacterized protein n=1 Tax=Pseudarthrobacter siccitolerans TaxID=861266 RepID=A0ABU0PG68_9MICC|nr:hypothetical protein [Pseudarthrobacter siccitolerans]MDQ0672957.1 hypothetical protein [Pseudarthrobacter siccitolerans]